MQQINFGPDTITRSVLKEFEDPMKMILFIQILRKPDITSHELKKHVYIKNTRIYYYLNQMMDHQPPLIEESGTEEVSSHLVRRKFRITPQMEQIFRQSITPDNPLVFRLYILYTANALQQQEIRKTKFMIEKEQELEASNTNLMFVDEDIAEEIRTEVAKIYQKCNNRYIGRDRLDAIRSCTYGTISCVYKLR